LGGWSSVVQHAALIYAKGVRDDIDAGTLRQIRSALNAEND
jgi:hypothetical protein